MLTGTVMLACLEVKMHVQCLLGSLHSFDTHNLEQGCRALFMGGCCSVEFKPQTHLLKSFWGPEDIEKLD